LIGWRQQPAALSPSHAINYRLLPIKRDSGENTNRVSKTLKDNMICVKVGQV